MLEDIFALDVSALELFVRTSTIYLLLVFAMRLLARREAGSLEIPDLLMIVLIADGVQNAMAGEYMSVTGGIIVGGTILGWNYALTFLMYRFSVVRKLLRPAPLSLVENGVLIRKHMRQEFITTEEVMSMLREQGVFDLKEIQIARLEAGGQLSVKRRNSSQSDEPRSPAPKKAGH